ncbi:MAG: pilus assembly protein [Acidimicrobiales bacterium]|nr:pilus assembly protein [Acidimicrobiales bacterium]
MPRSDAFERGQATVELALVLPAIVLVMLVVIQVAIVCLAQILVAEAARSAARVAAVEPSVTAARAAAARTPGLSSDRLMVLRGPRGEAGSMVSVTVRYRVPTDVPIAGSLLGDRTLTATAVYRVEEDAGSGDRGPPDRARSP